VGAADALLSFSELGVEQLGPILAIERQAFSNPWTAFDFCGAFFDASVLCLGMGLGGQLIGYALGYLHGADFHLANLAIDLCYRRQGWGNRLLRQTLAQARQKGCAICSLEVRERNIAALGLYRKAGFQEVAVRIGYYSSPKENASVMHRTIENF